MVAERELEQDFEARYDAVCKRVLSHKAILARIMQGCLAEYQDCEPDEIAENILRESRRWQMRRCCRLFRV